MNSFVEIKYPYEGDFIFINHQVDCPFLKGTRLKIDEIIGDYAVVRHPDLEHYFDMRFAGTYFHFEMKIKDRKRA